jgi:hypothetical protein
MYLILVNASQYGRADAKVISDFNNPNREPVFLSFHAQFANDNQDVITFCGKISSPAPLSVQSFRVTGSPGNSYKVA